MTLLEWKEIIERDEGVDVEGSWAMVQALDAQGLLRVHEIDGKCLILYGVLPEFNQELSLTEFLIYSIREHRGDVRLLTKVRRFFEDEAKANDCDCIKIGANFGFKDEAFSKILERWGFVPDTYRKEL